MLMADVAERMLVRLRVHEAHVARVEREYLTEARCAVLSIRSVMVMAAAPSPAESSRALRGLCALDSFARRHHHSLKALRGHLARADDSNGYGSPWPDAR